MLILECITQNRADEKNVKKWLRKLWTNSREKTVYKILHWFWRQFVLRKNVCKQGKRKSFAENTSVLETRNLEYCYDFFSLMLVINDVRDKQVITRGLAFLPKAMDS